MSELEQILWDKIRQQIYRLTFFLKNYLSGFPVRRLEETRGPKFRKGLSCIQSNNERIDLKKQNKIQIQIKQKKKIEKANMKKTPDKTRW